MDKEEISRYTRHLLLPEMGISGQEKLKKSKVLVIGAGGLGCPVLLYLTAAGVGEIGIVDFDKADESNLQRQILYSAEDIGKFKVTVAASKLSKQNPFVKVNPYPIRIGNKNALELFSEYDIVVDGTDNFATRYLVNDACVLLNKPLVYGAIHKFEGQVSVFNYSENSKDSGPTYRCLFPTPPKPGNTPNCSETGVLGVLPGIIGTIQATEVIKMIVGIGEPLSGKLLLFNALSMSFSTIELSRNDEWINSTPRNKEEFLKTDYEFFCGNRNTKSVTVKELQKMLEKKGDIQLLDVREPFEQPQIDELNDIKIPLAVISDQIHLITRGKKVIVICKSGQRSKKAIEILEKDFGFSNLYNLDGGITEWIKHFQSKK